MAIHTQIARKIGKDRTTANREVFQHRSFFNGTEKSVPKCIRLVRPHYGCCGSKKLSACGEPKYLYRAREYKGDKDCLEGRRRPSHAFLACCLFFTMITRYAAKGYTLIELVGTNTI